MGHARRCWAPRGGPPTATATDSPRVSAAATATTGAADVYPGAEDVPGNGVDENCEGGDAKASAASPAGGASAGRRVAPVAPRADGFKGNLLIITIDALRADRLGVAGYGRPAGRSLTPTLDALARQGRVFPARLVAGAQHPAVVPVDPDRPLPVRYRVGQAGHELPQPAAHRITRSSRRWPPRA